MPLPPQVEILTGLYGCDGRDDLCGVALDLRPACGGQHDRVPDQFRTQGTGVP
jgi:hypothetical protein